MSALGGRFEAVGEERVVPPDREQLLGRGPVADPAHDQPGGDRVPGGGERGEHRHLGDLGVGDQLTGVGVGHRARDSGPGSRRRREWCAIALVTDRFLTSTRENRAPATQAGADHRAVAVGGVAADQDLTGRAGRPGRCGWRR